MTWTSIVDIAGLTIQVNGCDDDRRESTLGALTELGGASRPSACIDVVDWSQERIFDMYHRQPAPGIRTWADETHGLMAIWDAANRTGTWAIAQPFFPHWEVGAPMRPLISFLLEDHGAALVHAAGVAGTKGGALLAGRSHTGKSTTTWNAVAQGYRSIGDDYCAVFPGSSIVHSVFASVKVGVDERTPNAFVGDALRHNGVDDRGRTVHRLSRPASSMLCKAILLPELSDESNPQLISAPGHHGLLEIVPTSIGQLPVDPQVAVRRIAAFLRAIPCQRLRWGQDRIASARILSNVIGDPIDDGESVA